MLFCNQQLQQPSTKNDPCCDKQLMINDDGALMCQSCGTVNDYQTVKDYINFYENRYKIVKKSIYERKYNLENTINDISNKYKLHISSHDRMKIHQIFKEIDKILPQINGNGKRMINLNFVMKKIFEMLKIPCDHTKITKSQTTDFYEQYWSHIQ